MNWLSFEKDRVISNIKCYWMGKKVMGYTKSHWISTLVISKPTVSIKCGSAEARLQLASWEDWEGRYDQCRMFFLRNLTVKIRHEWKWDHGVQQRSRKHMLVQFKKHRKDLSIDMPISWRGQRRRKWKSKVWIRRKIHRFSIHEAVESLIRSTSLTKRDNVFPPIMDDRRVEVKKNFM